MIIVGWVLLALLVIVLVWQARNIWQNHSNFNNIAIALCAILTLVWGAYTFDALHQKDKAEAEYAELQQKIRNTESTFFNIDATFTKSSDGYYITPVVTIKNSGSEPIYIKLKNDSVSIRAIEVRGDRVKSIKTYTPNIYEEIASNTNEKNIPIYDWKIPISAERKLNYVAKVESPGMYFITFSATETDSNFNEKNKDINGKPMIWFVSKYVYVK
ncbi:hypothetical protein FKK72_10150 [Klebsiella pneumoniae]|uniref:hypothetical protein n=1 Tax=Klebsiella pneumoniae complex TaxID=3390273 RepID=UPI0010346675|nr:MULTISPECIES: hypothetical protein [Klebsiella]HDT5237754.1 hypothetical protein [Klebsiella pneumoniae subsp. pneumoniae]MBK2839740.1 hypothetical protein [Klebsiella pneumoniae]MBW5552283.1 hypothetical protein [Klebsiella pneumoniae]MDA4042063.1 hypothetical protein [Klebsiella pneumoniae]MDP0975846.1 hypothetical protein [Klebsiella pneumoniae]